MLWLEATGNTVTLFMFLYLKPSVNKPHSDIGLLPVHVSVGETPAGAATLRLIKPHIIYLDI